MSGFNKSTHKQKFSAHAVSANQNKVNLKAKPVVNSSKNRIYDKEGDFHDLIDRKETKIYAMEILSIIKKARGWISGPQIRRKLNPDKIRMWDAAIGLLCDDIEVKNPLIPHYRYSKREVKKEPSRKVSNTHIFGKAFSEKAAKFPTEAIGEEYRDSKAL